MSINTPLTVRIPEDLNAKLKEQSKALGFTKTGIIKLSIYQFLDERPADLSKVNIEPYQGKPFRFVLNLNAFMSGLIAAASLKYGLSNNAVLIKVCALASQYYAELLSKLGFDS